MKKAYIYQYKIFKHCFIGYFVNIYDDNDIQTFEISKFNNDYDQLYTFINHIKYDEIKLISFNGLDFNSKVLRHILLKPTFNKGVVELYKEIYKIKENPNLYPIQNNPFIEIDLAAINNYNHAKLSTLEWIQFNMDWKEISEFEFELEQDLHEMDILKLRRECLNDCYSIKKLLMLNKHHVKVRQSLSSYFNLNLQNHSEPKLAKSIILKSLSTTTLTSENEIAQGRTHRESIILKDLILPYISFRTKHFNNALTKFQRLIINGENLKGSFKNELIYRGLPISFSLGGIHGAKKGQYKEDENYIIKTLDVKSFYPNLAIKNKWSPGHIDNKIFIYTFQWFYDERLKYDKDHELNFLYKQVLTALYGFSNDPNSFLKDSQLTMSITVNGELLLSMLMEELCERIPGTRPLIINTDAIDVIFPKEYEELYHQICNEWQQKTKLDLEFDTYKQLIVWSVNDYIAIHSSGEIKTKGRLEINKALHKNKSFRIRRIALYNYFILGISPEETLKSATNITDFVVGSRVKDGWELFAHENNSKKKLKETIRFFISKKGVKIKKERTTIVKEETTKLINNKTKTFPAGSTIKETIKVIGGETKETLLMRIDPQKKITEYDIDYEYYLQMIQKEIDIIEMN